MHTHTLLLLHLRLCADFAAIFITLFKCGQVLLPSLSSPSLPARMPQSQLLPFLRSLTHSLFLSPSLSPQFSIPFALHYSCVQLTDYLPHCCCRCCYWHVADIATPTLATSPDFYLSRCHNFIKNEMNGHCTTWHSKAFDAWHAKVRIQSIILMSIPCQVGQQLWEQPVGRGV